jgi:hypothetical protein
MVKKDQGRQQAPGQDAKPQEIQILEPLRKPLTDGHTFDLSHSANPMGPRTANSTGEIYGYDSIENRPEKALINDSGRAQKRYESF